MNPPVKPGTRGRTVIVLVTVCVVATFAAAWELTSEGRAFKAAMSPARPLEDQMSALIAFRATHPSSERARAAETRIDELRSEIRSRDVGRLVDRSATDPDGTITILLLLLTNDEYASLYDEIHSAIDKARAQSRHLHCTAARAAVAQRNWQQADKEIILGLRITGTDPTCQEAMTEYGEAVRAAAREALATDEPSIIADLVNERLVFEPDGGALAGVVDEAARAIGHRLKLALERLNDAIKTAGSAPAADPASIQDTFLEARGLLQAWSKLGVTTSERGEVFDGVDPPHHQQNDSTAKWLASDSDIEDLLQKLGTVRKRTVFLDAQIGPMQFSGYTNEGKRAIFIMLDSASRIEPPTWFTGSFGPGISGPARNGLGNEVWVPHFAEWPYDAEDQRRKLLAVLSESLKLLPTARSVDAAFVVGARRALTNELLAIHGESYCDNTDAARALRAKLPLLGEHPDVPRFQRVKSLKSVQWSEWLRRQAPMDQILDPLVRCSSMVPEDRFVWAKVGDVNEDGQDEALVWTWHSGGGNGWTEDLQIFRLEAGVPAEVARLECAKGGCSFDRIRTRGGVIEIDLDVWRRSDPMCCPSEKHTDRWRLQGATLTPSAPGNRAAVYEMDPRKRDAEMEQFRAEMKQRDEQVQGLLK